VSRSHRSSLALALLLAAGRLMADGSAITANDTLELVRDARPAALGGAYSALAAGPDAMSFNPAGLTDLRLTELEVSHMAYVQGINGEAAELGMPIYGLGAWGLGASTVYSSDQGRDNWGNSTGSFGNYDSSLMVALALQWRHFSAGVTYQMLRSDYAVQNKVEGAFALGSDFNFGLQARRLLDGRLDLGLSGQNFGTPMSLGNSTYSLPMTWSGGAAWSLLPQWKLAAEFSHQPVEFFNAWHFGTEYSIDLGSAGSVALRAGYVDSAQSQLGSGSGASAGLGLGWSAWHFDYAATSMGDFGLVHRLSLAYTFGGE
jgi:hypothetical protein